MNYVVVDDFGVTLNPLLLAGQVHGGVVQGIGQALMEDTVYDPGAGQLLSASFMDYAMPRAADAPPSCSKRATCRARTIRSASRALARPAPSAPVPAVINAILDALWRDYRIRAHRHAGDAAAGLGRD